MEHVYRTEGDYVYVVGDRKAAARLIARTAGTSLPAASVLVLTVHRKGSGFWKDGPGREVGAAVFGAPQGHDGEDRAAGRGADRHILELQRFEGDPELLPRLLQMAEELLVARGDYDLCKTYTSGSEANLGNLLCAAGWHYGGPGAPGVAGFMIGGSYVPRRTCNHKFKTSSVAGLKQKLREVYPARRFTVVPVRRPTSMYWKAFTAAGERRAAEQEWESLPHPQPGLSVPV